MVEWYQAVLGLAQGPRPDFAFPGAWLYAGNVALVHLVGHKDEPRVGSEVDLKLEHFAFAATGMEKFEKMLADRGHPFKKIAVPGAGMIQFHLADPDGNHIHIDFNMNE